MVPPAPHPYHGGKHAGLAPRPHETKTALPEFFEAALPQGRGGPPPCRQRLGSTLPDRVKYSRRVFVTISLLHPASWKHGRAPRHHKECVRCLHHLRMGDHLEGLGKGAAQGLGVRAFGSTMPCTPSAAKRVTLLAFWEGPRPHLNSTIRDRRPPQSRRCTYRFPRVARSTPWASRRRRCESPAEAHAQWWHSPGSPAPAHCPAFMPTALARDRIRPPSDRKIGRGRLMQKGGSRPPPRRRSPRAGTQACSQPARR